MNALRQLIIDKQAALKDDIKLYAHQDEALKATGNNTIYAHATGAGKTLTGIAKFEQLKQEGKANKALVIVPSGLRQNFSEEGVGKFTDSRVSVVGTKQERSKGTAFDIDPDADYNIISYDLFRRDPERYLKESGADTVITDESHRSRNEGTLTLESLQSPSFNAQVKNYIGLTGSVTSNTPADIVPLVQVASRGQIDIGKNKDDFMKRYVRRSDAKIYRDLHENRIPIVGFRHRRELIEKLKPYIHYMDHDDVKDIADFPNKDLEVIKVPITKEQAKLYKRMVKDDPAIHELIKKKRYETLKNDEASMAYNKLIEMRKLMNDPKSVVGPNVKTQVSPKVDRMLDDLEKHMATNPDGQALLFSHLINGGISTLEPELQARGIEYGKFIGKGNEGVTEESRQADIQAYKDRLKRVMLISSAGGEGLSLGDTTFEGVLDPHFNPEKMQQMEARGVRSGGLKGREDRTVDVNRYIATMPRTLGIFKSRYDTPDEIIYDIAMNKEQQNKIMHQLLKDVRKEQQKEMKKVAGLRGLLIEKQAGLIYKKIKNIDDIADYVEKKLIHEEEFRRSRLAMDAQYRKINKNDLQKVYDYLDKKGINWRIEPDESFKLMDKKDWNKDNLDRLSCAAVAECSTPEFYDELADMSEHIYKKEINRDRGIAAIGTSTAVAVGVGAQKAIKKKEQQKEMKKVAGLRDLIIEKLAAEMAEVPEKKIVTQDDLYEVARVVHEINRHYNKLLMDRVDPSWDELDEKDKANRISLLSETVPDIGDISAKKMHDMWVDQQHKEGWTFGEEYSKKKKTHPCIVSWKELPELEKAKDAMYLAVIKAMTELSFGIDKTIDGKIKEVRVPGGDKVLVNKAASLREMLIEKAAGEEVLPPEIREKYKEKLKRLRARRTGREKQAADAIPEIDNALATQLERDVATMMATSHEYKKPNVDAALAFVKNYTWEKGTEKVKNLQGLDKPTDQNKVNAIKEDIESCGHKLKAAVIVVDKIHGIRPQTRGKKILLDGHHRLKGAEAAGLEEIPVYRGTFTGAAQKPKEELREKTASEEAFKTRTQQQISRIQSQAAKSRMVEMKYQDAEGNLTTRFVEPYKLSGDDFWAYDPEKESIRRFKVAKIKSVKPSSKAYEPRWPVETQAPMTPLAKVAMELLQLTQMEYE